jgi:hypothetical protein
MKIFTETKFRKMKKTFSFQPQPELVGHYGKGGGRKESVTKEGR